MPKQSLQDAIRRLAHLGLIHLSGLGKEKVCTATRYGRQAANAPVDIYWSLALQAAARRGCLDSLSKAAAVSSTGASLPETEEIAENDFQRAISLTN